MKVTEFERQLCKGTEHRPQRMCVHRRDGESNLNWFHPNIVCEIIVT